MPDTPQLRRALGFWICLALVMGNTIGTGIFLLPAALAPYGANAVAGWLVTIAGCLCLAQVFAALARALPEADGAYDYIRPALGAPAAFFVMWSYWISSWVTNAAVAIGAVSYLSVLAPGFFAPVYAGPLTAAAFVILFTLIATRGAKASGEVQVATTILKLLPLIAVVALAAIVWGGYGEAEGGLAPAPLMPSSVAAAATLTLWAMLGFESATIPAGRIRDPQRTVPRATLAGTFLVGTVYLLVTWAVFLLLPTEEGCSGIGARPPAASPAPPQTIAASATTAISGRSLRIVVATWTSPDAFAPRVAMKVKRMTKATAVSGPA